MFDLYSSGFLRNTPILFFKIQEAASKRSSLCIYISCRTGASQRLSFRFTQGSLIEAQDVRINQQRQNNKWCYIFARIDRLRLPHYLMKRGKFGITLKVCESWPTMTLSGWHKKVRRNQKIHFSIYNYYFQWGQSHRQLMSLCGGLRAARSGKRGYIRVFKLCFDLC